MTRSNYEDTGCEMAPRCLECHLPRCIYDVPATSPEPRATKGRRDAEIVRLWDEGFRVVEIAPEVDTSERTVYRVLQKAAST